MNATSNNIIIDEYDKSLGYHPSVPPLDISLGLTSSYTTSILRWGILGCSKVAHDFTQALKFLSSNGLPHQVVAVGSRSLGRASTFAELHNIKQKHGSYEELCNNPNVDIIYVASLHPYHKEHAELALQCGKHVLIEKPITMSSEDAQYIYDLGKKLHKFVGEGMWTRFFPAVELTRKHLGEEEVVVEEVEEDAENEGIRVTSNTDIQRIGQVRVVQADFSIDGTDVGPYPSDSLFAKDLGGGVSWCVLPYIIAAATLPFDTQPERIAANGILPSDTDEAGDLAMGMTMTFNNNAKNEQGSKCPPKDKSIASGICSYLAESSEHTRYAAMRGRITIGSPAHCPTSCAIVRKSAGRGNGATSDSTDANPENCYIFPLPSATPEIKASGGIKMPNSLGFIYEAEATRRLISAGELIFPQWTPDESVGCIRIIEEMISQVTT